jgi:uncharacterized delta-60 repeat protein
MKYMLQSKKVTFVLCSIFMLVMGVRGQAGQLDLTFNQGPGANATILATAVQEDGKVIIGGEFTSFSGVETNYFTRLNPNGNVDLNFNIGAGANDIVRSVCLQSDGKIIVAGDFTSFNGVERNRIARLNSDGTLDASFNPNVNGTIHCIAIVSSGGIAIGGEFTTVGGTSRNRIAVLNTTGTNRVSFNPGNGVNGPVYAVAFHEGQVMIGGNFSNYNGVSKHKIARIALNGILQAAPSFSSAALNNPVYALSYQSDGKIIVGGAFNSSQSFRYVIRLNADYSYDTSFNTGVGPDAVVRTIGVQQDGKVILGGNFTNVNGPLRNRIVRLNSNGSTDHTFNPGSGFNDEVFSLAIQDHGKIIVAGNFTSFNGTERNRIARVLSCLPNISIDMITACGSYTWIDGTTYTSSNNTATHVLQNNGGCDSTVTLHLLLSIPDQNVSGSSLVCHNSDATISIDNSDANGIYFLRNDANNAIVDGPIAGTGAGLNFNTGKLAQTTTFNVLASLPSSSEALDFDGINDGVHVGQIQGITNSVSVEAWIFPKGNVGSTAWDRIFDGNWVNNFTFCSQGGMTNSLNLTMGGGAVITVPNVLVPNQWQHVAFTYDEISKVVRLYRNGLEIGSATYTGGLRTMTAPHTIGSNSTGTEAMNAIIDEVRLWNTTRTAAQLLNNMNTCLNGDEPGLVLYFDFEDETGNATVTDKTGNGHNGTLVNMTHATDWVGGVAICVSCEFEMTETVTITVHSESQAPTAINNLYNYCLGGSTVLEVADGSLSSGSDWEWFSGSCNSTPIGTGSSLEVSPNANTTYYVRASQGTACPPSDCESVVVTLPATSTNLSMDGEHATCFVNQNDWVHFYNSAGNLLASIHSDGQDLGNVQVTSHVANSPYETTACDNENNASFFQANLQRTFVITPENQLTNQVKVRLYLLDDEIAAYQTAALATTQNPHDDIATISDLNMTKVSGGTGSGDPTDFCGKLVSKKVIKQNYRHETRLISLDMAKNCCRMTQNCDE